MTYFASAVKVLAGPIAFAAAYYAVHTYMASPSIHDQLVKAVAVAKQSLPMKLDDVTTLTDERVDGLTWTYVNEVTVDPAAVDNSAKAGLAAEVTKKFCASEAMKKSMLQGVSYRYEYWHSGQHVTGFDVHCG